MTILFIEFNKNVILSDKIILTNLQCLLTKIVADLMLLLKLTVYFRIQRKLLANKGNIDRAYLLVSSHNNIHTRK